MSIGSVGIPQVAVVLGTVTPPQGDVIDLRIHLGCTKEVSSFELTLQNWNKKYSPGGQTPIIVPSNGSIYIGRGTNVPQIITCKVENIEYEEPSVDEHYLKVTGRCCGERLFGRVVSKTYTNQKGEAVVKDLMDSYAGLSHSRNGVELIEDTSTTYTELDYDNTTLWDILKYIAETADLNGAIGFDFRVVPDGKFEFFPLNSKAGSVSLVNIPEVTGYKKDITRVRNKIYVFGAAEKVYPASMDLWTEDTTGWSCDSGEALSADGTNKVYGNYSVYVQGVSTWPYPTARMRLALQSGVECGGHNGFQQLNYALRKTGQCIGGNYWFTDFYVRLMTDPNNYFEKHYAIADADQQDTRWAYFTDRLGTAYETQNSNEPYWIPQGNPDWRNINYIEFAGQGVCGPYQTNGWIAMNVDKLFFDKGRFSAVEQVAGDELRELSETDEELVTDGECDLRAKSLLAYYKDAAESLTVKSTILDYGSTPILPGDTVHITFPNENVDGDYRVDTVEYYVDGKEQTLEVTFELGKVSPQLADYLYGMRSKTINVEKLARTKAGVGQFTTGSLSGGGLGNHHVGHEVGDVNGVQYSSPAVGGWDPLTGWIAPNFIGPLNDVAAVTTFRTKNKSGSQLVDHQLQPSDNEHGIFGCESYHWNEIHGKLLTLYHGLGSPYGQLHIKNQGDANPLASLLEDRLQFGSGGTAALDTWLRRLVSGEFEVKNDLVPTGDNAGKIGHGGDSPRRWSEIHAIDLYASQFHWTGNLIPDADNLYDIGENVTPKRWRDIYLAGAIKALAGGVAVHFLPNADNTYNLGASGTRWGNLYLAGLADLGWLNIGGALVISSSRVLQNVTADAGIITSGQFSLLNMPRGTNGYVLEAEGASNNPMYVNPNGRYTPAGHNHAAGDITSGVLAEARCPNVYSGQITFNGGIITNSVNCKNWSAADVVFENKFAITEAEKLGFPRGLAFLNSRGKVIMVLNEKGNMQLLGKTSPHVRFRHLLRKHTRKQMEKN
jgi:hypothetical protein